MYSINNREELEDSNELVSLQSQVKAVRLQDELGKQNFHEDMKKIIEPITRSLEKTTQYKTKTITDSSTKDNKALSDLNKKVSELMNHKGMIAPFLASSSVNLFKPENKSQFGLKKDLNSTKINVFKINGGIPVTLYSNMLTL